MSDIEITNENYIDEGVRVFDVNGIEITHKQKIINTPLPGGIIITLGKTDIELYFGLLGVLKNCLLYEQSNKEILITILKIFNTIFNSLSFDYKSYFICFHKLIETINYHKWDLKYTHNFDLTSLESYNIYLEWLEIQNVKFDNYSEYLKIPPLTKMVETQETKLLSDLVIAANQLQGFQVNFNSLDGINKENTYNKQIAQTLINRGYIAKDQSEHGASFSGKTIGSPDIKIESKQGKTITLIEAFILKNIAKKCITDHLNKLFSYDPHTLNYNFLIVYLETPKEKFSNKFSRYIEHIENSKFRFPLIELSAIPPFQIDFDSGIRFIKSRFRINEDTETIIYHLIINMSLS